MFTKSNCQDSRKGIAVYGMLVGQKANNKQNIIRDLSVPSIILSAATKKRPAHSHAIALHRHAKNTDWPKTVISIPTEFSINGSPILKGSNTPDLAIITMLR